jgi:hypothetical protein
VGTQLGAVWRSSCTPKVGGRVWMFAARLCATLTWQYQLYCRCPGLKKREELSSDGVDRDWPSGRFKHRARFCVQGLFCGLHRFFLAPPPSHHAIHPPDCSAHIPGLFLLPVLGGQPDVNILWVVSVSRLAAGAGVATRVFGASQLSNCALHVLANVHCTCSPMCIARAGIG